jgi:predicted short-subunit dehydrogenase-like oxidoreductase (DUF2520 family)
MPPSIAIVGPGRLGRALHRALGTPPPLGRGADPAGADVVLLCVPDAEVPRAAAALTPRADVLVGHCSGALPLGGLDLSVHPLMTVTADGATFAGAGCAVAGRDAGALAVATAIAERLGMRPLHVPDADRAAYHAGASIAANFLVTLEDAAERVFGHDRALLAPLARAALENWLAQGPAALTGPIARGDDATVARQRAAVAERAPDLLAVWDALAHRTAALAAGAAR